FELTKGKVTVNGDLRAPGEEDIFILGDCAWVMDKEAGRPFPPTAQAAMQHAEVCASNIKSLLHDEPLEEFIFEDRGTVASLGVTDAIGNVFSGTELKGKPAAAMKMVVDNSSLFLLGGPKVLLNKGKYSHVEKSRIKIYYKLKGGKLMRKSLFNLILLAIAGVLGYAVASRYAEETRDFR